MTRKATQIYTIFGECEQAAAEHLIHEGKATRLPVAKFPRSAPAVSFMGQTAKFAVVVPGKYVAEFEELCRDLRA